LTGTYAGTPIPARRDSPSIVSIGKANHSEVINRIGGGACGKAFMVEHENLSSFEEVVLRHLDQAYNLARWLTHNKQDAEDVVQEACLRAFRFFPSFHGGDARAWLLKIVRNTCYTWMHANRPLQTATEFDEGCFSPEFRTPNPEEALLQHDDETLVRKALETLPTNFREVLILRELEGMSYTEIADITGIPMGTVMSSLSRGRDRLRQALSALMGRETAPTLRRVEAINR
jgi:RNA polymerase sigma-70 factor (ECF subfamily)